VGRLLRERRETVYVATKVPPKDFVWPAQRGVPVSKCYPPDHIVSCCEKSLRNLGSDHVDVLQLHTWQDEYLEQDAWKDALLGLKRSGKARFVGISVNDHDPASAMRAVASGILDTAQIIYNVFDQAPEAEFFPACLERGVGVLARVPFDEGGLTGAISPRSEFPRGDFRNRYFEGERKQQVYERAEALKALLDGEAKTLPELALRFCLSHDAVSTVIPGMRRVSSVEANVAVSDGRRFSPSMRERLRAHAWARNFYD
jgi:aryl-alcohol dehydrogenase-like predicted oxidoreductase